MTIVAKTLTHVIFACLPTLAVANTNDCTFQFNYSKFMPVSGKVATMEVNFNRKPPVASNVFVLFSEGEVVVGKIAESHKTRFEYEGHVVENYWATTVKIIDSNPTAWYEKYASRQDHYAVAVNAPNVSSRTLVRTIEYRGWTDQDFPLVRVLVGENVEARIETFCLNERTAKPSECDYHGVRFVEIKRGKARICKVEKPL